MNAIVPNIEYAGVGQEDTANLVKQREPVLTIAAKQVLGYSIASIIVTVNNAVYMEELLQRKYTILNDVKTGCS